MSCAGADSSDRRVLSAARISSLGRGGILAGPGAESGRRQSRFRGCPGGSRDGRLIGRSGWERDSDHVHISWRAAIWSPGRPEAASHGGGSGVSRLGSLGLLGEVVAEFLEEALASGADLLGARSRRTRGAAPPGGQSGAAGVSTTTSTSSSPRPRPLISGIPRPLIRRSRRSGCPVGTSRVVPGHRAWDTRSRPRARPGRS